jgi:hypothetical protein
MALALSCGEGGNGPQNDSAGCFSSDADADQPRGDVSEPSPFTKPEMELEEADPSLEEITASPGSVEASFFIAREHMRPDRTADFAWLYEGEDAVYDVGVTINPDNVRGYFSSGTYRLSVLVNMQPVDFAFFPVEETSGSQFIATSDIPDDPTTQRQVRVDLPAAEPVGFTLVIPSDAFEPTYAHDIRMVMVSDESPREQTAEVHSSHVIHRANCLYYGGTRTPQLNRRLDVEYVRPPSPVEFYTQLAGGFIYPEESIYSLDGLSRSDLNLGQTLRTQTAAAKLHGLVVSSSSDEGEEKYVRVLRDGRFLDEPQGLVEVPRIPSSPQNAGQYAARFSFAAALSDGEIHEYQILMFESPLGDNPSFFGVSDVNTLFLEYRPQ